MNKEALIQSIWEDRKERVDNSARALYVALSSPEPDLKRLTALCLDELSKKSNAKALERWARGWDRVVICVGPGGVDSCNLGLINDDKSKSYVPVATTRQVDPENFLRQMPEGKLGTILLNNNPTTIEGFLISYIHMLNQLIWDIYLSKLREAGLDQSPQLYIDAVEEVKDKGFCVATASEDEILSARALDERVSVRLYGSGVNKDVSKVMGAIIPSKTGNLLAGKFTEALSQAVSVSNEECRAAGQQVGGNRVPVVFSSVTFGKELHAGHMLLLATADLLRLGLGGAKPLSLINNNTGPRAAGALVRLSQNLNLGLEDTASLLDKGDIFVEDIIDAYRSRIETGKDLQQAFELLDSGEYDIFSAVSKKVAPRLEEAGFSAKIVAESENLLSSAEIIESVNPVWRDTGFMFSADKEVKILRRAGQLTATGKVIAYLAGLAKEPLEKGEEPFLVFVDGSKDVIDAAQTYSQLKSLGQAFQVPGTGIGFGGKIASGSKGEALTLTELLEEFKKRRPDGDLALALRQLVLTRPATLLTRNMSEAFFYDFYDNDSLIKTLVLSLDDAQIFRGRIDELLKSFGEGVAEKTVADVDDKFFAFLPKRRDVLLATPFEEIVRVMSKANIIGISDGRSDGFEKLRYGFNRSVRDLNTVDTVILESLIEGLENSTDITFYARQKGLRLPEVVFGNSFSVKNGILDAVLQQGYTREKAIERTKVYMGKKISLAVRANPYLGVIKSIERLGGRVGSLSQNDFSQVSEMINFSMRRLGF